MTEEKKEVDFVVEGETKDRTEKKRKDMTDLTDVHVSLHEAIIYGRESSCVPDISMFLDCAASAGFDFCVVPLSHPRNKRRAKDPKQRPLEAWTRSDMTLTSKHWTSLVVGKVSPWIDLDSKLLKLRKEGEDVFWQEINWAQHLSLTAVLLTPPKDISSVSNFAASVSRVVNSAGQMSVWISIPMTSCSNNDKDDDETTDISAKSTDMWLVWNKIKQFCGPNARLNVVLDVPADLPLKSSDIERWFGEPVTALRLSSRLFTVGEDGIPALSDAHKSVIQQFLAIQHPQIVISGALVADIEQQGSNYILAVETLARESRFMTALEKFCIPYRDLLEVPLQPLGDNLESATYEIFERDPVKYDRYEEAIHLALRDYRELRGPESVIVVMVVGAGRGPLVDRTLKASEEESIPVRVYVVEKNPNALVTLKSKRRNDPLWRKSVVDVVESDMRVWEAPEQADILVSELLGSFGDNELSPECLDGAQKFLKGLLFTSFTNHITSFI